MGAKIRFVGNRAHGALQPSVGERCELIRLVFVYQRLDDLVQRTLENLVQLI